MCSRTQAFTSLGPTGAHCSSRNSSQRSTPATVQMKLVVHPSGIQINCSLRLCSPQAVASLVAPNVFLQWENATDENFKLKWMSRVTPPVVAPFDFIAWGHGSCTAWSTLITYIFRSVGIPARQAGTPCWNGGSFMGRAVDNPNVSACWHGGRGDTVGGTFLDNHNWVEFYSTMTNQWEFLNVPPGTSVGDASLCKNFTAMHGCSWSNVTGCVGAHGAAAAMQDHPIVSPSWVLPTDDMQQLDGGEVLDVGSLKLSSGEAVSPLVWSPRLTSPIGTPLRTVGLRIINRTEWYRCKNDLTSPVVDSFR